MLRYLQGGAGGHEEDTDDEQPSTSSSGIHQPQPAVYQQCWCHRMCSVVEEAKSVAGVQGSITMAREAMLQQLIKNPERLKDLVDEAKDVALLSGLVIRTKEMANSSEVVTYYPFSLFPTPVPKAAFLQALAVQTHFNTLVDKISQDPDFLEEALASTIQADDFTAKLFDIYRHVQQEGRSQSIVVGLLRSDYMLDQGEGKTSSLKQIEINTISVGGFGVADCLPEVHRYVLRSLGLLEESKCVPDNNITPKMCAALAKSWELYGQKKAVIMFLFEDVKTSIINHRCMEKELCNRNIPVIRRKFEEVSRRGSLDDDKKLFIDGLEVAVVYYRTGYMPEHYTEKAWDARLMMERSMAVKCPDIGTHLAGTKKVQQVLTKPGVLEKFFPDQPQVVEQIRGTFAGLYTLDMGPEGDKTVEMSLAAPDQFVLKPQREGGGNNIYGSDICQVLQRVKESTERTAYILMDKIQPAPVQNFMLRRDFPLQIKNCDSELGMYGVYVRQGKDTVMNECVGHVMRTKSSEISEGGLASGVSVMDSPLLL
ncbi:glutathione synthetase-like isoform X4 [Acanthopagrus latus]|nr:glutathione synthetase-like isoform X4 [Acanthopagrus latus]